MGTDNERDAWWADGTVEVCVKHRMGVFRTITPAAAAIGGTTMARLVAMETEQLVHDVRRCEDGESETGLFRLLMWVWKDGKPHFTTTHYYPRKALGGQNIWWSIAEDLSRDAVNLYWNAYFKAFPLERHRYG